MNYSKKIFSVLKKLEQIRGMTIHEFDVSKGLEISLLKDIEKALKQKIPPEMTKFYCQHNGFSLQWSFASEMTNLFGFVNIMPLQKSIFGMKGNSKEIINKDRFEDMLWNTDFDNKLVNELKEHFLLEPFDGKSENTTFLFKKMIPQLYDVYVDVIKPYSISFDKYINTVVNWAGIRSVREYMLLTGETPVKGFNEETNLFFKLVNPAL
jgi:hypothetical protein